MNRGGILAYTPLLVAWFGIVEFGLFSLVAVGSQLLAGLLSLNGGIAVMREGAENAESGIQLFRKFSVITLAIGLVVAALVWPFDGSTSRWLSYVVLLGVAEGLQQLLLNLLRCRNRYYTFLSYSALRTLGFMVAIGVVHHLDGSLEALFQAQWLWTMALIAVCGLLFARQGPAMAVAEIQIRTVLKYALPMIPHSAAQWIINGSDRLIVKWIEGEQALGVYSLAYSCAMVVMLVNSGMALALPQQIIQNYERWAAGPLRTRALKYYTLIVVSPVLLVLLALEFDRRTMQWLGIESATVPAIVALVGAGLYLQGIYYLYGNFYFYHRKTAQLARQTAVAAATNLVLTVLLVSWLGIIGAAVATFLTYAIYLTMLVLGLKTIEPRISTMVRADFLMVPFSVLGLFVMGSLHAAWWH